MKFFNKALLGTLALTLTAPAMVPSVAQAQSPAELRHDKRNIHEEKRDVREARRWGSRHDVRSEKRDVRQARQEYREDLSDYRRYRADHRSAFRTTAWKSNLKYRAFRTGARIPAAYYSPRYSLTNYRAYRLPTPHANQRWVRNYNDVLLVNVRTGTVVKVVHNFYW